MLSITYPTYSQYFAQGPTHRSYLKILRWIDTNKMQACPTVISTVTHYTCGYVYICVCLTVKQNNAFITYCVLQTVCTLFYFHTGKTTKFILCPMKSLCTVWKTLVIKAVPEKCAPTPPSVSTSVSKSLFPPFFFMPYSYWVSMTGRSSFPLLHPWYIFSMPSS